jgi:hypothetical protein
VLSPAPLSSGSPDLPISGDLSQFVNSIAFHRHELNRRSAGGESPRTVESGRDSRPEVRGGESTRDVLLQLSQQT